jgi:hypothetical protein
MPGRTERGYKPDGVELVKGNMGYLFFEEKPERARRTFIDILGMNDEKGTFPAGLYIGRMHPAKAKETFKIIASHEYNGNEAVARRVDELPYKQLVSQLNSPDYQINVSELSKPNMAVKDHLKQPIETVALVEADYMFTQNDANAMVRFISTLCEISQGTNGVLIAQMNPAIMETKFCAQMRAAGEVYDGS